jgi:hypothetical protein
MFINLTHNNNGRVLLNVEHIISIVEEDGMILVVARDAPHALEVLETYDEIITRINASRQKVW